MLSYGQQCVKLTFSLTRAAGLVKYFNIRLSELKSYIVQTSMKMKRYELITELITQACLQCPTTF